MKPVDEWIQSLNLQPHPEGGFFKEMYRSDETIAVSNLPRRYQGDRSFGTSIYYLLTGDTFSAFHRIQSDEIWHFYEGDALELFQLAPNGELAVHRMSRDEKKPLLQVTIPRGHWFGARCAKKNSYSLVGCTVNPGFDFQDFEMADRSALQKEFPQHKDIIGELTRI